MEHPPARRPPRAVLVAAVVVWLALLVGPPAYLLRFRSEWLASLERPQAQAQWDEFRDAMREQSGRAGPVQRKVPKSVEPPLRVWLRDYAWLAIAAWVVLGGTLGLFTGLFAFGATAAGGPASAAEDQPRRGRDHEEQDDGDAEDAEEGGHES
ncbi:MAG: hypothetical protein ACKOB1_07830 [Planctomycetia bacterium]